MELLDSKGNSTSSNSRNAPKSGAAGDTKKRLLNNQKQEDFACYDLAKLQSVSLDFIEQSVEERIRVLKIISDAKGKFATKNHLFAENVDKQLRQAKLWNELFFQSNADAPSERNATSNKENNNSALKDVVSFYFLCLALCKNPQFKRQIRLQEEDLFTYRYQIQNIGSKQQFLAQNDLNFTPIGMDEKMSMIDDLQVALGESKITLETNDVFCVPFTEALSLMRSYKCLLVAGNAYVANRDVVNIASAKFRHRYAKTQVQCSRNQEQTMEDERIRDLLELIEKKFAQINMAASVYQKKTLNGDDLGFDATAGSLTEELIQTSFPPCMQRMMTNLVQQCHLKYEARNELGLFLKDIGFTMQESMQFFKSIFCKKMSLEKFEKEYAYNIRYNYGLEGKKSDFSGFSCARMASRATDINGCFFKIDNQNSIPSKLKSLKSDMSEFDIEDISSAVSSHQYRSACSIFFKAVHDINHEETLFVPNKPSNFFHNSREVIKKKDTETIV